MPIPRRSYDRSLNPELERLLYQEDVILQEAEGLYWGLSESQLYWSPPGGGWSIGQCIDHLNATNVKMAGGLDSAIKQGRAAGILHDGPYVYGFLSRWFLRLLQPPVKKKFKAPPELEPAARKPLADLLASWKDSHARIKELLHASQGLDLARVKVQSPASSWLKYPLGVAFWLQTAHDRRHLWQMRQIRNNPSFPAS